MLSTGCITVTPSSGRGALLDRNPRAAPGLVVEIRGDAQHMATGSNAPARLLRRRGERVQGTEVAMVSPAEMAVHAVASGAVQVDAFEYLLALAGLDNVNDEPPRGAPLTPQEAARVLTVLMNKPVTLGSFPPRMAVCHLLREVLEGGDVSREELLRRVERFKSVAVLRPDGYLAWTLNGRTQQKVGPVEWKEEAFRAGSFELGRFYTVSGWVFRQADAQLRPLMEGPPLAEVYDDADYIGRSLDGAEEAFVEMYHAMGQLLTRPLDSIAALRHLPAGVAALIASSPEYLERFRYMTRGEQVKATSKLLTYLLVTFGTAGGTTSTLTRAVGGLEATVPVLSLSAEGLLVVERVVVPVGRAATVLSGGPGSAIILYQVGSGGGGEGGGEERTGGTNWKPGPNDLDWRGVGKGVPEALDEAFKRTGVSREEFAVTKWGRDKLGKSAPVEWRAPNGAEVNIDMGHIKNGPSVPHVGFQTPGKRGSGGAIRGHILLDDVPYNR
ncbi:hypothetical protein D187_005663 [Cystobacter fuscus DSM 2262]|uniref:Bacterial toxin 47 domain-containing protein n=1 Tax=Cystobacter fuscus (strain ATCC 25194 / DSM 2262 / NBRC 100088 / M29) TaxID=1242864 RepID=S9PLA8_CYSF2|nr:hypothetical protein D187_005663 [Cystobacter fuscus DSM 2262]